MNRDALIATILKLTLGLCSLALPLQALLGIYSLVAVNAVLICVSVLGLWLVRRGQGEVASLLFLVLACVAMAVQAIDTGGSDSPYLYAFPLMALIAVFLRGVGTGFVVFVIGISAGPAVDALAAQGLVTIGPMPHSFLPQMMYGLAGLLFAYVPSMAWKRAIVDAQAHEQAALGALAERDVELERRAQVEMALQDALQEAGQASQAKSVFLASMSHELRTPLNAILGYAELLMEDSNDAQDTADLQRIRASGDHLLDLINDVLDLSKIEAGKMQVEREDVHLDSLLRDVTQAIEPAAAARGNQLRIESPALGTVPADTRRTRQVLLNLLSNAAKFTEHGQIVVRATTTEIDGNEQVEITVQDTGVGIPPEQLERLFQPFVQVENEPSRRVGGTGLGLVLSRRFARMMGGDVTATSRPGVGSTFRLVLPRKIVHTPLPGSTDYRRRSLPPVAPVAP